MSDVLLIDSAGHLGTPPEELRQRLAKHPGAWQVLGVGPGLLVAIRRGEGILAELPHLELSSPALAGDLAGIPASDLLSLLHQSRRTGLLVASSGGIERCA